MSSGETTVASAPSVVESAPAAIGAQSMVPSVNAPPKPTPIIVEKADAGLTAEKTEERVVVTPHAVPASEHRAVWAAPAAPAPAKVTPPPANVKKPSVTPQKRDDNAAGI